MKYTLRDLIDIEKFQTLQDKLNEIYTFPSAIIDNDGKILTATAWQDVCTKFHRQHSECEKECVKSDQYILSYIGEADPAITYRCPHGLVDNAMPIIVDGAHLGNFFTGQFFLEEPDLKFFRTQAAKYGFDERAYIEAVKKVPVWTREQLDSYLLFIKGLIDVISGTGLKNLRAIEAQEKSEERELEFQAMFDMASIGIAQADPHTGQLLRVNQKLCDITGYTSTELLSLRFPEITHPEDRGQDWEAFQRVIRGEAPNYQIEKRCIRKDGAVVWVSVNMTVIRDGAGQPMRTMTAVEDISERKRAEEEVHMLKRSIDLHPEGAYWGDSEGRIIYVNDAACKVLGYEPGELIGKMISDVNPTITPEKKAAVLGQLRKDRIYRTESVHRRKDGSEFPVEIVTSYVQFDGKEYTCGFASDITERKRTEKDLVERESRLSALFDNAGYAISLACGGKQILGNPAFQRLFGYKDAAELAGSQVIDTIAPDERDRIRRYMADRVTGKGAPTLYETKGLRRDGSIFDMEVRISMYVSQGEVYTVGFQRDITDHKRAEKALRESEERLKEAQSIARLGSYVLDLSTRSWVSSDELDRLLGIDERYERSMEGWAALFHPDDLAMMTDYFRKGVLGRGESFDKEYRIIRHDSGAERWVHALGRLEFDAGGHPLKMTGTVQDITGRKQAEEAFHRSREAFKVLADNAPDIVARFDRQFRHLYVSPSVEKTTGRRVDEFIGKTNDELGMPKNLCGLWESAISNVFETGRQHKTEFLFPSGKGIMAFSTVLVPEFAMDGSVETVLSVSRDITDLKKAEETLKKSERDLLEAQRLAHIGSWSYDPATQQPEWSEEMFHIWGLDPQYGAPAYSEHVNLIHPEDYPLFDDAVREAVEHGTPYQLDLRICCPDGTIRTIITTCETQCDENGGVISLRGTNQDITERKQAEEDKAKLEAQLHQAQKMESVGRLAGGVAHDFNNMLGVILGYTDIAMDQVKPGHSLHESLVEIRKAAGRSAELTRQLLTFARKQAVTPKVLDLNETIAGVLKMLQRLIGEDIHLEWHPSPNAWAVMIDPSQIDQILANLCVNARDAIADVGKVTIETANRSFDATHRADHVGFVPGEYVMLAVSDNGCGMDRETVAHIFEPFFTTKKVGQGTGLGLATVYGAVSQNNGFINVCSEPGQGTTFTVYLPRHADEAPDVRLKNDSASAPRGNETVLLAEDDPSVLKLAAKLLEGQGYTVLAARTPDAALRISEQYPGEVDLLITDVIMPDMNGRDLSRQLSSGRPRIKNLFMSGYTADVIAHHGVLEEGVHFIQKPFSATDLAVKVRKVLDSD